jgi:hypothetical protein
LVGLGTQTAQRLLQQVGEPQGLRPSFAKAHERGLPEPVIRRERVARRGLEQGLADGERVSIK